MAMSIRIHLPLARYYHNLLYASSDRFYPFFRGTMLRVSTLLNVLAMKGGKFLYDTLPF